VSDARGLVARDDLMGGLSAEFQAPGFLEGALSPRGRPRPGWVRKRTLVCTARA